MAVFIYQGVKGQKKVSGVIEADTRSSALQKLKKDGIIVIKIAERSSVNGKIEGLKKVSGQNLSATSQVSVFESLRKLFTTQITFSRVTKRDIAVFSRQVASLLKSGMSLTESLDTIARQTRKMVFRYLILELSEGIKGGKSFSQVLSEHSNVFPEIYIGMVKAGETSGELDKVMEDLGEYLEKQIEIRSKVVSAMVYPVFVVSVMGVVLWILLSFVVPKISELLQDVGRSLPFYTRALITFSHIFSAVFPYIVISLLIFLVFRKKILSVKRVRFYYDLMRLKIPIYSRIHTLGEFYRIFSTLATLTRAGVPLVKAVETAEAISSNIHIKNVLKESREYIVEGRNMSEKLAESGIFPPMIYNMVAVGERSGELERMFWNISQTLSSELETFMSGVTSIIEPILILLIGGLIFFVMLSIIVPILDINRSIM